LKPVVSPGQFGASFGKTSISFTSKSPSVPLVETKSCGITCPVIVTSSASGSVWKVSTSDRCDAKR